MDVTDEPGYPAVAGPPGKHPEALQIRVEVLVRLVNADEASMEEPSNIHWLLTAFSIWDAVMATF